MAARGRIYTFTIEHDGTGFKVHAGLRDNEEFELLVEQGMFKKCEKSVAYLDDDIIFQMNSAGGIHNALTPDSARSLLGCHILTVEKVVAFEKSVDEHLFLYHITYDEGKGLGVKAWLPSFSSHKEEGEVNTTRHKKMATYDAGEKLGEIWFPEGDATLDPDHARRILQIV